MIIQINGAQGGISGIVSRTTTAPLDRLKVYLIAQTKNAEQTLAAAKSGAPLAALRGAWATSANAMKELWAAGGMRSLFAGASYLRAYNEERSAYTAR